MSDKRFIKVIFERYHTDLKRYIGRKFGGRHDTEDIVQDAFCNILKSEKVENIENPKAYLYQSAINLALKRIKKESYLSQYVEMADHELASVSPERPVSAYKSLERAEGVLAQLPDKYRRTFELSRVHMKSYKEISGELGIATSTVEKHIMKVLKHIRENEEELS